MFYGQKADMSTMNRQLNVRNVRQKILFEHELSGQISDGKWENSRPHSHWIPWCDASVVVDPKNVGRNFQPDRDSYNFNDADLIDIIGDRMLAYVRIGLKFGQCYVSIFDTLVFDGAVRGIPDYKGNYWDVKRAEIKKALSDLNVSLSYVRAVVESDHVYGGNDLVNDLRDLKKIVKTTAR